MTSIEVDLPLLQSMPIPPPERGTDKDSRGRVLFLGGSSISPGAAVLAGEAALRSGAGKVMAGVAKSFAASLGMAAPEFGVLALPQTPQGEPSNGAFGSIKKSLNLCDAVLVGPGMMDEANALSLAEKVLLATDKPVVLDAAAITGFRDDSAALRASKHLPILTPHAGEMASLAGASIEQIEREPARFAFQAASTMNSVIVLKGAKTFIAHPRGEVWCHTGGVAGLGTAGSGDVLAGLLAGLVARGTPAIAACLWSVHLHAEAGSRLAKSVGSLGFLARELSPLFPRLLDAHGCNIPS